MLAKIPHFKHLIAIALISIGSTAAFAGAGEKIATKAGLKLTESLLKHAGAPAPIVDLFGSGDAEPIDYGRIASLVAKELDTHDRKLAMNQHAEALTRNQKALANLQRNWARTDFEGRRLLARDLNAIFSEVGMIADDLWSNYPIYGIELIALVETLRVGIIAAGAQERDPASNFSFIQLQEEASALAYRFGTLASNMADYEKKFGKSKMGNSCSFNRKTLLYNCNLWRGKPWDYYAHYELKRKMQMNMMSISLVGAAAQRIPSERIKGNRVDWIDISNETDHEFVVKRHEAINEYYFFSDDGGAPFEGKFYTDWHFPEAERPIPYPQPWTVITQEPSKAKGGYWGAEMASRPLYDTDWFGIYLKKKPNDYDCMDRAEVTWLYGQYRFTDASLKGGPYINYDDEGIRDYSRTVRRINEPAHDWLDNYGCQARLVANFQIPPGQATLTIRGIDTDIVARATPYWVEDWGKASFEIEDRDVILHTNGQKNMAMTHHQCKATCEANASCEMVRVHRKDFSQCEMGAHRGRMSSTNADNNVVSMRITSRTGNYVIHSNH